MKKRTLIYPFILIGCVLMLASSCKKDDDNKNTIKDIDGNVYHSITIGTQVWMLENLKVTKYNDGTAIPLVTDATEWSLLTTPGFCWFNNDESANKNSYGGLYNWYAVNTGKLAPTGWHVPTDAEWTVLENYLVVNGYNYDGTTTGNKYAKALASATGWTPDAGTGTAGNTDYPNYRNKSGFTALPGGYRHKAGWDDSIGVFGGWWSSTEPNAASAWMRGVYNYEIYVERSNYEKQYGFFVRCLRD